MENASGEPLSIPQKPVRLGASTEAAVEGSSDSGKPIRLHELQESGAGGNGSADQPHRHASNPNHGPLPLTGSDPFSARRSERIVTYLEPDSSLRSGNQRKQPADMDAERIAIGDGAEKAVVKYESSAVALLYMQPGNRGYDVYVSTSPTSKQERYIEVKGTDGEWDRMGVGLTKPQFKLAKDSRQFWLYVVEWARTEMATVYPIPDPYSRIGQFRFDGGWKSLAEYDRSDTPTQPSQLVQANPSDCVEFTHMNELRVGTVREIKGALKLLVIEIDTGELVEKLPTSALRVLRETAYGTNDPRP